MKKIFPWLGLFLLMFCMGSETILSNQETELKVVNKSRYSVENIVLFSLKFNTLAPGESSGYKVLNFDRIKDDPLLYCSVESKNMALYVEIPSEKEKYIYSIDSINLNYMLLYISIIRAK